MKSRTLLVLMGIWLTWWLGDMAGALVVAPVIYLWAAEPRARAARREVLELSLVLAAQTSEDRTIETHP